MNKKISVLIFFFAFFSTFHLYAMPPQPNKCPSVNLIRAAGLSSAYLSSSGYVVTQVDYYGTEDKWLFGFAPFEADSSEDALNKGHKLLATLSGTPKPVAIAQYELWGCLYYTTSGVYGIALSPIDEVAFTPKTLIASLR